MDSNDNKEGKLINRWGRRGPGPNEFLMPVFCHYSDGIFAVFDLGKRKIFIFNIHDKSNLKLIKSFKCIDLGNNIFVNGKQILISGDKKDKDGKHYNLYILDPYANTINYLLPLETKYGVESVKEYLTRNRNDYFFNTLGGIGYGDWQGDYVYYAWHGNLKIFKINVKSNKIETFGKITENYIKPTVTKSMIQARLRRSMNPSEGGATKKAVRAWNDRDKMSFIIGLFAGDSLVGVMYRKSMITPETKPGAFIQFYKPDGTFLSEKEMPETPSNVGFFRKKDNTLFAINSMDHLESEEDDGYPFIINVYKISK